jgi:hypothetical protein
MGKSFSAFQYISTTGAGIAIGTGGVLVSGIIRGSDLAGTLTLKDSAATILVMSASGAVSFVPPVAFRGPLTMTSSAGDHFVVFYRDI